MHFSSLFFSWLFDNKKKIIFFINFLYITLSKWNYLKIALGHFYYSPGEFPWMQSPKPLWNCQNYMICSIPKQCLLWLTKIISSIRNLKSVCRTYTFIYRKVLCLPETSLHHHVSHDQPSMKEIRKYCCKYTTDTVRERLLRLWD